MVKAHSGALETHLAQVGTTLTSAWRIKRTDGQVFRFTANTRDVTADFGIGEGVQTYVASAGYRRTNIQNDAELNVNNLDVQGVFDDASIKEDELRRGLFDFAEVRIFFFNYEDTSQGVSKQFRGFQGEVQVVPDGSFTVEMRSLEEVFSKAVVEFYSKDCRADLGDARCRLPLMPDLVQSLTAYSLGDFVRASSSLENRPTLLVPADVDEDDVSQFAAPGTLGSQAVVQTTVKKFGAGAFELSPSGSVNPANAFVSYPDASEYAIGTNQFTIEFWWRTKDTADTVQVMASKYLNSGNNREWFIQRNGNQVDLWMSANGIAAAFTINGSFTFLQDTFYHIAVTRDASDDVRLFVDGTQVGSTVNSAASIFDGTSVLYLGKLRAVGFDDQPTDGFVDDFRFINGFAAYTGNFTAPTAAHPTFAGVEAGLLCEDFDDRIYVATTAGTTLPAQPAYDTVVGNTTADGTAVFTTEEAWTRCAEVSAVDGTEPRRKFTVTELTPVTGGPRGGFPDDWFNFGAATFETGPNAGRAMEVRDFVEGASTQDVELFLDMPFDIAVGDKLRIFPGCDKLISTCRDKFDNEENFVGEPYVPGSDYLGTYPDAR